MRDLEQAAYAATVRAAEAIVDSCVDSIRERIRSGEVTEDTLSDVIHEETDSALTYTITHYVLAWGLRDEEDAVEEGIASADSFGSVLAAQAYCNLRSALEAHDFSDDFAVAKDAAAEVAS